MPNLLPRPSGATPIRCPSCGHYVNNHQENRRCATGHIAAELCECTWTPNDIAWWQLYGQLSRPPLPERPAPLSDPVVPDARPRALRGLGGLLPW